jgi:hypothetical protein
MPMLHAAKRQRYISGYEDHPYYSEDSKVKRQEARGFKRIVDEKHESRKAMHDVEGAQSTKRPDSRTARNVEDYREIQDNDPYADIFKERGTVARVRLREWRKQFEKENENVELPYERTNPLFRAVPNYWVRFFVKVRSQGFLDPFYLHVGVGMLLCFVMCWTSASQVSSRFSRDHTKLA